MFMFMKIFLNSNLGNNIIHTQKSFPKILLGKNAFIKNVLILFLKQKYFEKKFVKKIVFYFLILVFIYICIIIS